MGMNTNAVTTTDQDIRDAIRQMLEDWETASPQQRAEALAKAARKAARAAEAAPGAIRR